VTAVNHFQTAIFSTHFVNSRKNRQMLDVLDVSVCVGIDVRVKPA
jgi:hypothetical protein